MDERGREARAESREQKWPARVRIILFSILGGFLGLTLTLWGLDRLYPLGLEGRAKALVVTDRHGSPLRAFADPDGVWRFPAGVHEVSPLYLEALTAYEDQYFYHHPGINPLSLVRALAQNLRNTRVISGGSTLTMQTARVLGLTGSGPPLKKKLVQMLRALQLEVHLTKEEILGLYLTHAPFGANIQGVRAAAFTWLGKDARELTHAEAALLAVLPQAPSRFRPDRHPEAAQRARDKVLARLKDFKIWPDQTIAMAREERVIPYRFESPMTAPLAARRLRTRYPGRALIPTFLDQELQTHLAEVVRFYVSGLSPGQSGAAMLVDTKDMSVLAYVGSADFSSQARKGHVDMVRALRSPGSTLKPFIYGLAIDQGLIHSHSMLLDVPRIGQPYDPGNFTGGFQGPVTVEKALQDSLNLPAVQVLEAYGPGRFHDRLKHGGARFRFRGKPNLSMALGGVGTDLESLVTLYSALVNQGQAARPRLTPSQPLTKRYLMSPGAAHIILRLLSRPLPGEAEIARLAGQWPMAWKTGTSYGFRDAWAIGIKGRFLAGVWVGRPDGSPSPGQYGAVTAVPLLSQVLESIDRPGPFPKPPDSLGQKSICWPSGLAREELEKRGNMPLGACVRRHRAWILNHQVPPTLTGEKGLAAPLVKTIWVDDQGRRATPLCGGKKRVSLALWPWQAEPFIPKQWRRTGRIPMASENCPDLAPVSSPGIRITSIADQSILRPQPGDQGRVMIPLRALGIRGRSHWFLNRVPLERGANAMVMPGPGSYQLAVVDETGKSGQVSFRVVSGN